MIKEHFNNVFSPTLPVNADEAVQFLEKNLKELLPDNNILLIGCSLGDFYTLYLAEKYPEV